MIVHAFREEDGIAAAEEKRDPQIAQMDADFKSAKSGAICGCFFSACVAFAAKRCGPPTAGSTAPSLGFQDSIYRLPVPCSQLPALRSLLPPLHLPRAYVMMLQEV